MTSPLQAIEEEIRRSSAGAESREAEHYWSCHRPRYQYVAELIGELNATRSFARVLDIGMSFETPLLSRLLPSARIDCLGVYEDSRFRPLRDFTFYAADLNDVTLPGWSGPVPREAFDLIVFMEVIEHLYTPPELVLRYLATLLRPGGVIVVTTPNAAWLKNRLKLLRGRNPFEQLRPERTNMGHIRECTQPELVTAFARAGLEAIRFDRRGLYRFDNAKDNIYSWIADHSHSSLSRSLVAVGEKRRG